MYRILNIGQRIPRRKAVKNILTTVAAIALATPVFANEAASNVRVFDHTKTVTTNVPITTTQCQNVQVPIYETVQGGGNAVEGAVGGAIVGAIIGEVLGGDKNASNTGAVFGAIVGGDKAANGTRQVVTGYATERQCTDKVTYQQQTREVYSHSTVRFSVNGYRYVLKFDRSDR